MIKFLLFFMYIFLGIFIQNVSAENISINDETMYYLVHKGDTVCGLYVYTYDVNVYDYDKEEKSYVFLGTMPSYYDENNRCIDIDFQPLYDSGVDELKYDSFIFATDSSSYGRNAVILPYLEPEFSVTCDREKLKYGEESKCLLSYETQNFIDISSMEGSNLSTLPICIEELSFEFNNDDFKIVDYDSSYTIENNENNYSLKFSGSGVCTSSTGNLFEFTVTSTNKDLSGDKFDISFDNFNYIDTFNTGTSGPSTSLGIEKIDEVVNDDKVEKNPDTFSGTKVLIIVVISILSLGIMYFLRKKKILEEI